MSYLYHPNFLILNGGVLFDARQICSHKFQAFWHWAHNNPRFFCMLKGSKYCIFFILSLIYRSTAGGIKLIIGKIKWIKHILSIINSSDRNWLIWMDGINSSLVVFLSNDKSAKTKIYAPKWTELARKESWP